MNDEQDIIGTRRKTPVDLGPLFASGSDSQGSGVTNTSAQSGAVPTHPVRRGQLHDMPKPGRVEDAIAWHDRKHEKEIEKVAPLLRGLAKERGPRGVNAIDTRRLAIAAGVVTGAEEGRALSWLANVPRRAGLISAGLDATWTGTGNRPTKYLHPDFVDNQGAA